MPQEIILKIGDLIEYSDGQKGQIEKIRIISSGKLVEQYVYDGKGNDIVLTLKGNCSVTNLWLKNRVIHKITEKQEKG
jgi:hypothetical protein